MKQVNKIGTCPDVKKNNVNTGLCDWTGFQKLETFLVTEGLTNGSKYSICSDNFLKAEIVNNLLSFRSSHQEVLLVKGVVKICSKFKAEHPCRSVIYQGCWFRFFAINKNKNFNYALAFLLQQQQFPRNS